MSALILNEQSSSPSTPAATKVKLFVDNTATPQLKTVDDTGTITTQLDNANTATVKNKTLDATNALSDTADTTKKIAWQASGATTGTTLTVAEAQTTSQVLNVPNIAASSIIITDTLAQNITGAKTFGNAGLLINNPAATFPVTISPSAEVAARVLTIPLLGAADTIVTLGTVQTITGVKTLTTPNIGAATGTSLAATGAITSNGTAGIGYATGAGGTVTQATSKATGVTLSKITGQITMNAAALNTLTIVSFVVTNTLVAATDIIVLNHMATGTFGAYTLNARAATGSFTIDIRNNSASNLSEAIVIGFAVIKSVTA